ncbi:MAG TPA: PqqD family protein [Thermoanaerobaculia bacterium]|nr:PqqD family protein [Thermoanaerobaculia bacterium]
MPESHVYRRSPDVVCRQVGAESILVPIRHNVGNLDFVYTLSPVAARVWTLLDGNRSIDAIANELSGEFEVDLSTAAADVAALLADLAGASLVSEVA